ncbi:response regulator [Eudoraea chungangensis]|uniref:response regulator n=1 Tax=Eudoraea chungangensis TaxID=1481905 RepID=UPI0023EC6F4E|nr:response regulator [Eudoraea chungangensis]
MKKTTFSLLKTPVSFILFLLFCLSISSSFAQEQLGKPLITNYRYQDYGASPSNWWALEDNNGVMYFANGSGILQYDGINWNTIELTRIGGVRSLRKDGNGVIHVGGVGEMGYIETDEKGEYHYKTLLDEIPEEHRVFKDVWEIDYYKGRVIFRTEFKLYAWDGETMKVITSKDGYHVGNVVNNVYYLRIWGVGLCILKDDDTFELVPGGEAFASERIYSILPYDDTNLLIGTRTQGFYLYNGEKFSPFKTELDEYVKDRLYLPGVALDDGSYILNTFSDGAYLMSHDGKLIQKYTTANGLQDGSVDYVYVDSRGVLWLMLLNGISTSNLSSNFTLIDSDMGLSTNVVNDVYRFNGVLYLSNNDGVAYLDEKEKMIKSIPGTFGQGTNFLELNDKLYLGTNGMGLIEITGKTFRYIRENIDYDFRAGVLYQSESDPNRIYVSHQQGIISFYYDEIKNQLNEESSTNERIRSSANMTEASDGSLWVESTEDNQVIRFYPKIVDGNLDFAASEFVYYDREDGLPASRMFFGRIDDEIAFWASEVEEVYAFNEEDNRFVKREDFFFQEYIDFNRQGTGLVKDDRGNYWFDVGGGLMVASKDENGDFSINTETFKELKNNRIWNIYLEKTKDDNTQLAWFIGPGGVIRYEGDLSKPFVPNFNVEIRNFSIAGDSTLYAGNIEVPQNLKVPYANNSVNISYAAPLFIGQKEMQYSTQLVGLDENWSEWSKQSSREYINLPPGKYSFKVKAQNVYGNISEEKSIDFSIAAPWYRTWWAYVLYVLGFLAIVYAIVKTRTNILIKQQKELEERVEERTREANQRLNELATVNQVSKALTEKIELKELIQLVGNKMKDLFNSDITYLALLDPATNIIDFPYQDGDNMEPMKYGEGLTSKIIQTGKALLINKDTDITAEYEKSGIEQTGKQAISYLGVPIPVEDSIIGVLSVQSTEQESRFNDEDKRLLNTIAINVGVALHNAELFEDAKVAKAKAEDANEAKSAFLSTVSHELRTPLTSVLGFAKIIRKRLEDKIFPAVNVEDQKIKRTMKQVSENLNVVVSEGERLTSLINDVLDLAKIESGRMEWNFKPIFIQDVIGRAVSATSSLFEEKKLELIKNIPEDLPLISGDEDKLIQVVINLLSNAVKFTEKGKITIDAYEDKGQVIFEIQDTGIGIADDDRHKIFERFRQAGDTLTDKPQGTGLGLPICREIIEHHGGIIWLNSEYNVGSTFFFSIPTLGDGASQQPMQLDRILTSLKKQIKHTSLKNLEETPTILVVDDDTPIRSLLRQELGEAGYQVKEAANGKAALDMVRISKPDLIILDVMMPEINGFDVAAVLKNDPATMDIPIIILSIVQDKERGLRIGVDRYLTKPIDTEKLFHEVDELLEQGVSKKKVLVVDDDVSAVKTLTDVLTARGYKVMEANPDNLIETATAQKPDIIMLNSVLNGDEKTIKELKFQKGMENVMFFVYQ